MQQTLRLPLLFAIPTLLVGVVCLSTTAQQKTAPTTHTVDWNALIPQIEIALGAGWEECNADHRAVGIVHTGELSGGVPVAVVEYCHMGAYTADLGLIWLENGRPMLARLRDEQGR